MLAFQQQQNISYIWSKIRTTDPNVEHKQCLNDFVFRTVRYSLRLSTAGGNLLFTGSVSNRNITVHTLQCVTVLKQDT